MVWHRKVCIPGLRQIDKAGGYLSFILNIDSCLSKWIEDSSSRLNFLQKSHRILQKSQLPDWAANSDRVSLIRKRGSQKSIFWHLSHNCATFELWKGVSDICWSLNRLLAKILSTGNSQSLLSCSKFMFSSQKWDLNNLQGIHTGFTAVSLCLLFNRGVTHWLLLGSKLSSVYRLSVTLTKMGLLLTC
jgi:hypothetical protein